MNQAYEIQYQLELLKRELEKKENSEFKPVLKHLVEIQKLYSLNDSKKCRSILLKLEVICNDQSKNYFALSLVGFCHQHCIGFKSTIPSEVVRFFSAALEAKDDFGFAAYHLGLFSDNKETALKWLIKAFDAEFPPAAYALGLVQYGGDFSTGPYNLQTASFRDREKLQCALKTSAELGYSQAQFDYFKLMICLHVTNPSLKKEERKEAHEDLKYALDCLQIAAENNHQEAQYELGKCYQKGIPFLLAVNPESAIYWFNACMKNSCQDLQFDMIIGAYFHLGEVYETYKEYPNYLVKASEYYQQVKELSIKRFRYPKELYENPIIFQNKDFISGGGNLRPFWEKNLNPSDSLEYRLAVAKTHYNYSVETLNPFLNQCNQKIKQLSSYVKNARQENTMVLLQFGLPKDVILLCSNYELNREQPMKCANMKRAKVKE